MISFERREKIFRLLEKVKQTDYMFHEEDSVTTQVKSELNDLLWEFSRNGKTISDLAQTAKDAILFKLRGQLSDTELSFRDINHGFAVTKLFARAIANQNYPIARLLFILRKILYGDDIIDALNELDESYDDYDNGNFSSWGQKHPEKRPPVFSSVLELINAATEDEFLYRVFFRVLLDKFPELLPHLHTHPNPISILAQPLIQDIPLDTSTPIDYETVLSAISRASLNAINNFFEQQPHLFEDPIIFLAAFYAVENTIVYLKREGKKVGKIIKFYDIILKHHNISV